MGLKQIYLVGVGYILWNWLYFFYQNKEIKFNAAHARQSPVF